MFYADDEVYDIQIGDQVEAKKALYSKAIEGEVVKLFPRKRQVKIRYEDWHDCYRTTGKPRIKSATFDPIHLNLLQRVM